MSSTNELLKQRLDIDVLAKKITPKAAMYLYERFKDDCEVDPVANEVFLRKTQKSLFDDTCLDEIYKADADLLAPRTFEPSAADTLAALQAEVLATGAPGKHGDLWKMMGDAEYQKWKVANRAQPGRAVDQRDPLTEIQAKLDELKGGKPGTSTGSYDNPWTMPNDDPKAIERRQSIIKTSTKLADSLAKKAGKTLTGQPLRGAA